jgi:hypothetical protein
MNKRLAAAILFIAAAAVARVIPHPPNVTPIAAMALFGGAFLANRRLALAVPLAAMLLSDVVLGLTVYGNVLFFSQPVVYLALLATVAIGRLLRGNKSPHRVLLAALASSLMFFVVTNFAVWASERLYSRDWSGLLACYIAAIPFFRNSVAGDLAFVVILFGGYALWEKSTFPISEKAEALSV